MRWLADQRFPGRPDISRAVPQRGRRVVLARPATHDGGVSSTAHPAHPARSAGEASMTPNLLPDLERFWPSRRGHAFDELCR